jgi:4-amino-4-deoxy-L-arabinose transferase-like glycosyltransferase
LARLFALLLLVQILAWGWQVRARIADGWRYTGADGYVYMDAATELAQNHSYGARRPAWVRDQPKVAPLSYCRPPGYPLFIVAVARPPLPDYATFFARIQPVQAAIDLATCLLVFALAYRLGGLAAAYPALLLAAFSPFLALYAGSILTETLASFLTTAALTALVFLVTGRGRGGGALLLAIGAGVATGLLSLVRADGLLLVPCLLLPLLGEGQPRRQRLLLTAASLLALTVVFAPWPLRNVYRFGAPHLGGHLCETTGAAVERIAVTDWMATWIEDEEALPTTLWCLLSPHCTPKVDDFPPAAFESPAERDRVAALLLLQYRERFSVPFDDGFRALAAERRHRQPLGDKLRLWLRRVKHLWVSSNDLPIRGVRQLPWPQVMERLQPRLQRLFLVTDGLAISGLLGLLLLPRWRRHRLAGLVAGVALLGRTGYLALAGYVESRYILELLPLTLALGGVALTIVIDLLRQPTDRSSS